MTWYSPLVPLVLGTLILAVCAFMSRPRLAVVGLLLVLPGYALMTPLGANLLVLVIEHRVKAAEADPVCERVQAAVLLSGGLRRPAETATDFGALTAETLARIFAWKNLELAENSPRLPLTVTGGGPFRIPEAAVIGSLLLRLDSDPQSLQLEIASESTWESAQAVRGLLPHSTDRIALASSALHLPRAMLAFGEAGFEVCPVVLNRHYLAATGWSTLLPHSSSLTKSEAALHEIIGEAFYRINPPTSVQETSTEHLDHDQESSKKSGWNIVQ